MRSTVRSAITVRWPTVAEWIQVGLLFVIMVMMFADGARN